MSVVVKRRREAATFLSTFTGANAELIVDTTNYRLQVHDGVTAGGWPAAKLADLAAYAPLASPALTGTPTAPTAAAGTNTTQIATTAFVLANATSSGVSSVAGRTGSVTLGVADVAGAAPLASPALSGTPTAPTATAGNNSNQIATTSFVAASFITYGYASANYATLSNASLTGTPTAPTPSAADNSTKLATTAYVTTALTTAFARSQVSDAAYTIQPTDRTVAVVALTAARLLTLPPASAYPQGATLTLVDESGACSATKTLTLTRVGSDTINGAATAVLSTAYGYLALESNGSNKWTVIDQSTASLAQQAAAAVAITGGTIDATAIGGTTPAAASVVAPASGDSSARAITSAWFTQNLTGGFVNRFRNGTMDIFQRGTAAITVTTAGAYTADGWIVVPTGASCTAARAPGRSLTVNSLQITGASSVTDILIKQRIESYIAAAMTGQQVTVQAQVYNNTGGAIVPTLTVKHPTAQDNYTATTTDVSAAALQSCASGAWTQISYTFAASAGSANGMEIGIDFGNNFGTTSKSVQITECDIRVTPNVASGANTSPPPVELRPINTELPFCQRYFQTYNTYIVIGQSFGSGLRYDAYTPWPVQFRYSPTVIYTGVTYGNASGLTDNGSTASYWLRYITSISSGLTYTNVSTVTASAEL